LDIKSTLNNLLTPRLSPIIISMLLLFILILVIEFFLDMSLISKIRMQDFLATSRDDHGYIMKTLSNIEKTDKKKVFLIGGSSMREALPSSKILEKEIQNRTAEEFKFFNLSSFSQTPGESLQILDTLITKNIINENDILITGINPRRMSVSKNDLVFSLNNTRMPFLETKELMNFLNINYEKEITKNLLVWRMRNWLYSWFNGHLPYKLKVNISSLLRLECSLKCFKEIFSNLSLNFPINYLQYAYPNKAMSNHEKLKITKNISSSRLNSFKENYRDSLDLFIHIQKISNENDIRVIFVDLPRDPLSSKAYAAINQSYIKALNVLESNAQVVNWSISENFISENFYDLDHLLPNKRNELMQKIFNLINENTKPNY
jgi:hypothetical protein